MLRFPTRRAAAALPLAVFALALPATPAPADTTGALDFPTAALLPKEETGIAALLAKHPEYDGRGIVVAIFDTGVDPGAPGLQITSDGKPKIVDLVDGSGSGDVATKTTRQADAEGRITGLSGRTLNVSALRSAKGEFRVGLKPAWELWPNGLVTRMKAKRKELQEEQHRVLLASARQALEDFDRAHPAPADDTKLQREELVARVDMLRQLGEKEPDPGPVFDCVVFHDGEHWRAAVDTDEDGDLGDEKAMTNYRTFREWATFDEESLLNFGVNIYNDGDLLSIVTDCGSHGTHVAGIVAAHDPNDRLRDGMAPGVQLVSVKIGDTRLGSSSTGTGTVRGLAAVLANGCKVINMSYGGATAAPDDGRIIDLFRDIVNEHGVTFICSAGNSGPALSTVGGPGGTTTEIMGIGAYLSSEMMAAQYSIRDKLPDTHYTWSSRGPTFDGAIGPALSAPGGAFAPVPNWTLQPTALLNGTSMASPSVCGGVACLLSGAKAEGIPTTPHDIRRALENTAEQPAGADPFTVGRGLARFDRAWDALRTHRPHASRGLRFDVNIPSRDDARGVYLRDADEANRAHDLLVEITPTFAKEEANREHVAFERRFNLSSTAAWVQAPASYVGIAGMRSFKIKVDPRGLPPGVHYAEVRGVDVAEPQRGPLFRVPITVVRPETLPADMQWTKTLTFGPNEIRRFFLAVPEGATWADIAVTAQNPETPRQIVVHAVQALPGMQFSDWNSDDTVWLGEKDRWVKSIPVAGGYTLELCLAQYWSNLGPGKIDVQVAFHGLLPNDGRVDVDGAELSRALMVKAPIRPEAIKPTAEATVLRKTLLPASTELRALTGARDSLPKGQQAWEMVLTYEFELDENAKVLPRVALAEDGEVWESFESMLWTLFDSNKRRIEDGPQNTPVSLKKGKHTLRFHVRHSDESVLRKLDRMPVALDRTLDPAVKLRVLTDPDGAVTGGFEAGAKTLAKGQAMPLWIAPPAPGAVPKGAKPGDVLIGSLRFGPKGDDLEGAGDRPNGWPLTVRLASDRVEEKDQKTPETKPPGGPKKKTADELDEELLKLQVDHLAKLRKDERHDDFEALSRRLLKENPRALPVLVERMRYLADKKDASPEAVVKACDEVVATAAASQLAEVLGERALPEDEKGKARRADAEKRRDALVEALRRKVEALAGDEDADREVEEAYREISRWTDPGKGEGVSVVVEFERRRGRPAKALEALNGRLEEAVPERKLVEQRLKVLEELGWSAWAERERRWLMLRFPEEFPPF